MGFNKKNIVRYYAFLSFIYISVHLFKNENRTSSDFSTVIKRVKTTLIKCTLLPLRKSVKCKKKKRICKTNKGFFLITIWDVNIITRLKSFQSHSLRNGCQILPFYDCLMTILINCLTRDVRNGWAALTSHPLCPDFWPCKLFPNLTTKLSQKS